MGKAGTDVGAEAGIEINETHESSWNQAIFWRMPKWCPLVPEEFQENSRPIPPINSSLSSANNKENNNNMKNIDEITQHDVSQNNMIGEHSELKSSDITENEVVKAKKTVTRPHSRPIWCGQYRQF